MVARRNLTLEDVAKSWLVGSPVKFILRPELSAKTFVPATTFRSALDLLPESTDVPFRINDRSKGANTRNGGFRQRYLCPQIDSLLVHGVNVRDVHVIHPRLSWILSFYYRAIDFGSI